MVICLMIYLYCNFAHEPLKLKALQAQKRMGFSTHKVMRVTKSMSSTTSTVVKRINSKLKVAVVKSFTYEELAEATDNFSEKNTIGQGGFGTVYVGKLRDGKQVAIKRTDAGSEQGTQEFYIEIELLSRVHHKHLVMLEGYCDEEGHQMLVYEYMPGGTLRDQLTASSRTPLDFPSRLRIALGAARGISYLHTEANPPIYHRDIKPSNILLDNRKVAKVADFGLSCLAPVADMEGLTPNHVSTVVKGTPGYLDPDYYMTQQFTDKSDVYSFGVVLLELISGRRAVSEGKNIVREANKRVEEGTLLDMVDPHIAQYEKEALEWFLELALSCCREMHEKRPTMGEVVSDLEQLGRAHVEAFSEEIIIDRSPKLPSKPRRRRSPDPRLSPGSSGGVWDESMMHISPR